MFRKIAQPAQGVTVEVDGTPVRASLGETVADLLLRQTEVGFGVNAASGRVRAPYCMMGVCFECLVEIDGRDSQACLMPVREGMRITRRMGRPEVAA
ncbi:(2Fe-2S)-binding protein [Cereibacter sp. SYSU M97828]|nr:(2Fe-2S)-binding protein [Cereibacter flavus]